MPVLGGKESKLGKREQKYSLIAAFSAAAVLCLFSACASSTPEATDAPLEAPPAASLDESALATPPPANEASDAAAFGDLQAKNAGADASAVIAPEAKKDEDSFTVTEETKAPAEAPTATEGDTFYKSIGGESIRRVAYTLYGDSSFAKSLLEKNPGLKDVKKLEAEQKVFFDMDSAQPEPTYLTKDLINRYAAPLAERLNSVATKKGIEKTTVTISKGETLQDVSRRLYGSHRYWTEIYLVNQDKLENYDKVKPGIILSVFKRPGSVATAKSLKEEPQTEAPVVAAASTEEPAATQGDEAKTDTKNTEGKDLGQKENQVPAIAPTAALPIQAEAAPALPTTVKPAVVSQTQPVDPIPETPTTPPASSVVAATMVKELPPIQPVSIVNEAPKATLLGHLDTLEPISANVNFRRILYVSLIVLIGGAAFYFTRSPKKQKMDILDLNADAMARPKLAPKDGKIHNIG